MNEEPKDIKSIFAEALEKKTPEDRAAYLDKACGGDADLRSKLESLLESHDQAGNFLESPPFEATITMNKAPVVEQPGDSIGPYKLLEKIGEGGMAYVYMAEQERPLRRRVALKIIKLGMDTKQVIARFEVERQALAVMDHPNIAKVFDAGATETGRPYFVMELVKGVSITEYCDKNNLSTKERLDLFIQVCNAVQHAHQKGIIHRDIKPSNVMVTLHDGKPVPKVIDFGIAKATIQRLTEKTLFTKYAQMIGTPEYMSPEQAEMSGLDIDTRADIYSLGVLLYELLTGTTPFAAEDLRSKGYGEMQRIIRETEPLKPSTKLSTMGDALTGVAEHRKTNPDLLAKLVRGDLDWIVMKTLEKDRTRRYETASALAADIRRHFGDEPVEAGPPSAIYRIRKFVQRHRRTVAAAVTIAATLIIGLLVSTSMYVLANRARHNEAVARTKAEQAKVIAEQSQKAEQEQRKLAETKAEDLRRSSYVNSIQLADAKYREGNIGRVRELLESCPNDLHGWEWHRLNYITDQSSKTLRGHEGFIVSMALSPDGKQVASRGIDGTVKVWDWQTGVELSTIHVSTRTRGPVVFSPDGKRLSSGSSVWDAKTGAELTTLRGHEAGVASVSLSPDGERIVSGGGDGVKVWDVATGVELMTLGGHERRVNSVAFSPDGKRIASGNGDATVTIWDAASGRQLIDLKGHKRGVNSVRFSPDGKQIASASDDETIRLWDVSTGGELVTLRGHTKSISSVAYDQKGKLIVSGSWDGTIKIWDVTTGDELMTLRGHRGPVSSALFSLDGEMVISAGFWDKTIKVWDIGTCGERTITQISNVQVRSIVFSPDGKHIVSSDGRIWDARTGVELMSLSGCTGREKPSLNVSFSPDGKRIVGGWDRTVGLWDATTGKEIMTLQAHGKSIRSIAVSPDGTRIAVATMDKTIIISDTTTGAEVMKLPGHQDWAVSVAYSPDGSRIVSGGREGTIKVWSTETGAELMTLSGHENSVMQVTFSPDGKRIVSCGHISIKTWDAATGSELMTLSGHAALVFSISFSPDGKRLVSGGGDGVKVWDVATGVELMTVASGGYVSWVAFSPDGKTIAAAGSDNIMLWESGPPAGGYGPRRTAEAARRVVDELHQKYGYYYEVIDKLQADKALDEPIRKLALQIANSRKWEDAETLVAELYKKHGSYHEVIGELQADKTLDEPTREIALQIANSRKTEDAEKLVKESMEVVNSPGGDPNVYRAALEKVEKANRMDPNNPDILVALGMAQHLAGKYEDAIKTLTKAAALEPNELAILGALSDAQYRAGKYGDAVKTLTKVLEINRRDLGEQDWSTLYSMNQLAWMQATSPAAEFRNGAEAVKNATRVCELTEWKKAQYVDTLAAAYSEVGDFDSAVKWQKKAISLLTKEDPAQWPGEFDERLKLYESGKPYRESP